MHETAKAFAVTGLVLWIVGVFAQDLCLSNRYPEEGNFSYVNLTCSGDDANNAVFLWNKSNLTDSMEVVQYGPGSMTVVLTQEMEGEFQCTANGRNSTPMLLAGNLQLLCLFLF